jgi:hypothetical protein
MPLSAAQTEFIKEFIAAEEEHSKATRGMCDVAVIALRTAARIRDVRPAERVLVELLTPGASQFASEDTGSALAAAGGVGAVLAAVEAFGRTHPVVLHHGCVVLRLLGSLNAVPPDHEAAAVAALRVALRAPAAADEVGQRFQLLGLTEALVSSRASQADAALRAEVLAAGAVERLVAAEARNKSLQGFRALTRLCGLLGTPLDACARRVVTAGAVDVAVATLQQTRGKSDFNNVGLMTNAAQLLMVMHDGVRQAGASDEALVSAFRGRQAEIVDALLAGLAGPARASSDAVASLVGALMSVFMSAEGERCTPERAAAATDCLLDVSRFVLKEHATPEIACTCAVAVVGCAGACGGADTAAPGTHAWRAGALPLVEAAVEAAKRSGDVAYTQVIETATLFLRTLRRLEAGATPPDAGAPPPDAELEARLQRATEASNMAELVALARDGIQRGDADLLMRALNPLITALGGEKTAAQEKSSDEAVAAGGVALAVAAVKTCGGTNHRVLEAGCVLLRYFADLQPPPPRVVSSSIVALRIALKVEPSTDLSFARAQLNALARVIPAARVAGDAALRAEVLDAGGVERLLAGARQFLTLPWPECALPSLIIGALFRLCGPPVTEPDACALSIITSGGVDVAVSAVQLWKSGDGRKRVVALAGANLLAHLREVASNAATPSEAVVSAFRDEAAIFTAMLDLIPGQDAVEAAYTIQQLSSFATRVQGDRCAPPHAAKATEAAVVILRRMLADVISLVAVFYCADTLRAFAGGCSVDETAAPGTHALRLGALPLLQSMLPAVNAELAEGGNDKAARKQCRIITDFVGKLRVLEARREAAAAALVAEEEVERAQRSKAAQGSKVNAAKAKAKKGAAATKKPPAAEVDQAAAELSDMAIADASAGAAAGGPPPAEALPVVPPAAPATAPPAASLQAAPPPLPPWLAQVMQQPPPSPPPPAAASRAAQAQRPPHIAAASTQRQPVSSPPAGMSAGDLVPRELECAICLDAAAEGRTRCCGQTAFCRPCAATLTGECPLCRAPPRAA